PARVAGRPVDDEGTHAGGARFPHTTGLRGEPSTMPDTLPTASLDSEQASSLGKRTVAAAALAVLSALLAGVLATEGCKSVRNAFAPVSRVSVQPCPVKPDGYSNKDRLEAMLSVQAHALFSDRQLEILHLAPAPLDGAIQVLRCDHGRA